MPYGTASIDILESSGNLSVTGNLVTTGTIASSVGTTYPLVSDTAKASTSGTTIDFTGIPSWAKRITLMFSEVSTNGTSNWLIQLGTASGVETSGYLGVGGFSGATSGGTNYTAGFGLQIGSATHVMHGSFFINLLNPTTNTWTCTGSCGGTGGGAGYIYSTSGAKSLSSILDRVRVTTVNGTDAFDAGSVNIMYE